jgi:hypothetical protein
MCNRYTIHILLATWEHVQSLQHTCTAGSLGTFAIVTHTGTVGSLGTYAIIIVARIEECRFVVHLDCKEMNTTCISKEHRTLRQKSQQSNQQQATGNRQQATSNYPHILLLGDFVYLNDSRSDQDDRDVGITKKVA